MGSHEAPSCEPGYAHQTISSQQQQQYKKNSFFALRSTCSPNATTHDKPDLSPPSSGTPPLPGRETLPFFLLIFRIPTSSLGATPDGHPHLFRADGCLFIDYF